MHKKPSVRGVTGIGRRRLLRQSREVIEQRLHRIDSRVSYESPADLGNGLVRDSALLRYTRPVAFYLIQSAQDGAKHRFLLVCHSNAPENV